MKQPIQDFTRRFCRTGKLVAVFDLPDYLRLTHHKTVQARCNRQQVPDRIFILVRVEEPAEFVQLNVVKLCEELGKFSRISSLAVFAGTIQLYAVASRYKYELSLTEPLFKLAKRPAGLGGIEGKLLANLHRGGFMVES